MSLIPEPQHHTHTHPRSELRRRESNAANNNNNSNNSDAGAIFLKKHKILSDKMFTGRGIEVLDRTSIVDA